MTADRQPEQGQELLPPGREGLVRAYAEILATDGVHRGLLGPREAPDIWDRHILNSAAVATAITPGADVCDVGSGAGLPGLVVAIARPDLAVTLIEPLLRRTQFLEEVVTRLALPNVWVHRGRADSLRTQFDTVLARAVAPLERLAPMSAPLARPGGVLLAHKGARAEEELALSETARRQAGWVTAEILRLGRGVLVQPVTVVKLTRAA